MIIRETFKYSIDFYCCKIQIQRTDQSKFLNIKILYQNYVREMEQKVHRETRKM